MGFFGVHVSLSPSVSGLAVLKCAVSLILILQLFSPCHGAPPVDSHLGQSCSTQLHCGSGGLLCLEGVCSYCNIDAECQSVVQAQYRCFKESTSNTSALQSHGLCLHKRLFKPFHWKDALTILIIFTGSCVAAGAGVGGGALNVAMLVFIAGFSPSDAVPLSSVMIGGGAIANFLHAIRRQRLTAPRPLIDFHASSLLQPSILTGNILGIILNRVLPDWLILSVMTATIIYTIYTTTQKFWKTWRADRAAPTAVLGGEIELEELEVDDENLEELHESNDHSSKREALEQQEQQIPIWKLALSFGLMGLITLHSILLGGKGGSSIAGIRNCTWQYWLFTFALLPPLAGIGWFLGRQLVKLYEEKRSCGFQFLPSDIEWSPKRIYIALGVSVGAGCLSSLLGVGVGMVINPLLWSMGSAPDCSAATSSFLILFSSASAIVQYGVIGRIQWDYALFLFFLGLLGSVVGQNILGAIVKRYKSQAYILLAMLLITAPGAILLLTSMLTGLIQGIKAGAGVGFKDMCKL